jgi:hypothetical protein
MNQTKKTEVSSIDSMTILNHEAFNSIFLLKNDVYLNIFGKNRLGKELLKVGTLMNRINRICEATHKDMWSIYPDDNDCPGTGLLRYKGDIFEIFIECFLNILGSTPSVGVFHYKPEKKENDLGVDGYGYGSDNKKLTVQIKYRSDAKKRLDQSDIKQFAFHSYVTYGVDIKSNSNMLLITSCAGMYPMTKTRTFCSKIREINLEQIKNLIDDNHVFWNNLSKLINNTIRVIYGTKVLGEVNINSRLSIVSDEDTIDETLPKRIGIEKVG